MAGTQQQDDVRRLRTAALWANALAQTFKRVALFEIKGTDARVVYLKGLDLSCRGERLSLLSQNPLRWSIEAASPIVGSGRSPGVDQIQEALHIERPRAFTVMPIVIDGKIRAFTYADNDHEPFSLEAVSQLFETCQNAVEHKDPSAVFEQPKRSRRKSSSHFETLLSGSTRRIRSQAPSSRPLLTQPTRSTQFVEGPLRTQRRLQIQLQFKRSHRVYRRQRLHIVTPDGIVPLEKFRAHAKTKSRFLKPLSTLASGAAAIASLDSFGSLPVGGPNSDQRVEITRGSTVKEIGENLEAQGLVRSGKAFQLLARSKAWIMPCAPVIIDYKARCGVGRS